MRLPRTLAFWARAVTRLPPRSRLRQAALRRSVQLATAASNRGDYEAAFMFWHPQCESIFPAQFPTVGTEPGTRDREDRIRFQEQWIEEWGEFRFEPEEMIDFGHRLFVLGRVKGSGLSSGAAFDSEWALLVTNPAGLVIREQVWFDHAEALEAVGLSE